MKRVLMMIVGVALTMSLTAAPKNIKYVKATDLSLLGKMCETTNPYHRLDVDKYPDFTYLMFWGAAVSDIVSATPTIIIKILFIVVSKFNKKGCPLQDNPILKRSPLCFQLV